MPIYTKTGDKGITSLFGGKRVSKSDVQIEAYGSIDELSSFVGLVVNILKRKSDKEFLVNLQKDFYKIMASLSGAKIDLVFLEKKIFDFEEQINNLDKKLPKLKRFILPGGSEISSWFHILRAICRRAERKVIKYNQKELRIIKYLNRLSDLFFTLARYYNREKEVVVL